MGEQEVQVDDVSSYTEAHHTSYAAVSGAEPLDAGSQSFTPARVTAKYGWRTQLGDQGWKVDNIEISGPWLDAERVGTGRVIMVPSTAPEWARAFAEANMPTSTIADGPAR